MEDDKEAAEGTPPPERAHAGEGASPDKKPWQEPKLTFVEPKLTKHGKLEELTQANGFFGQFSP
jgi:hypothetical protein